MRREDEERFARVGAAAGEGSAARLIGRLVAEDLRGTIEAPLPERMRHLLRDLQAPASQHDAGAAHAAGGGAAHPSQ